MACGLQVLSAAEDALRRLQVSGAERNAILDTLRYMDGVHERQVSRAQAGAGPQQVAAQSAPSRPETSDAKPFTRCSNPVQLCTSAAAHQLDL